MNKQQVIEAVLAHLAQELQTISQAARAAHEAATHEESKPEDSHDTRGLEASYLAGAQAARAAELESLITMFKLYPTQLKPMSRVEPGALVELESNGKNSHYFIVARGGGISVKVAGKAIHLITLNAPLGEALEGKVAGDTAEVETLGASREYEVISVS